MDTCNIFSTCNTIQKWEWMIYYYVYLMIQLIHVDLLQKPTQYSKTTILQLKTNNFFLKTCPSLKRRCAEPRFKTLAHFSHDLSLHWEVEFHLLGLSHWDSCRVLGEAPNGCASVFTGDMRGKQRLGVMLRSLETQNSPGLRQADSSPAPSG